MTMMTSPATSLANTSADGTSNAGGTDSKIDECCSSSTPPQSSSSSSSKTKIEHDDDDDDTLLPTKTASTSDAIAQHSSNDVDTEEQKHEEQEEPVGGECRTSTTSSSINSSSGLPGKQARRSSALEEDEFYPKTLQDEMNEIMEAFYATVSEEDMYAYQSFVEDISQKKVAEGALSDVGEVAPDFELEDQDGDYVQLTDLVKKGPVVVVFYRGKWCPHCNAMILALSKSFERIKKKGASLVAISPMLPDGTQFLATKRSLMFPVCSDVGNVVARKYRITFEVQPEIREKMVEWGEDVPTHNGDDTWEIPLPATYIIGEDGRIVWSFIDNDPGVRASPEEILSAIPESSRVQSFGHDDDNSDVGEDGRLKKEHPKRNSWPRPVKDVSIEERSKSFNRRHLSSTFKNCKKTIRKVFGKKKQPPMEYMSEFFLPPEEERTDDLSLPGSVKSSPR